MKAKVIYCTKTGHSRKIANRIGEELKIESLDVKENPEIEEVDLLFVVGGIYGGQSDKTLLEYIDSLPEGAVKEAVLMTSCTSMTSPQKQVRERLSAKGVNVTEDEFICRGNFLIFGWGHPNKEDLQNAADFARRVLEGHLQEA